MRGEKKQERTKRENKRVKERNKREIRGQLSWKHKNRT